ncbi:MAG: type IV toxin-antitoxin system AbiEi family antitoxin [Bryobacteraceae bacterium]|nr:type IV toxin-antitoxin system AbiEi family antitoxin [Bryobacteraceae bacterium]
MGSQTEGKLNQLQRRLPEGMVVDAGWLEEQGVSRQLRRKYVQHGWLIPLARGVYRRPSASKPPGPLPWQELVVSLNVFLHRPVSVGARTALELQGFGHYAAASGSREAHLYGNEDPPKWVSHVPVNTRLVFHSATKLFRNGAIPSSAGEAEAGANATVTQQAWGQSDWTLTVSTPERAILELLDEVPKRETFHQADVLMEGLRNLSPRRLQVLLVDCKNVKVKRLFFWFADRHNHAWLQKIDRSAIDLGKGKRMLVRGGKLDPKYNITVPENLDAGG